VVAAVIIGAAGGSIRPVQKLSPVQAPPKAPFQRKEVLLLLKRPDPGAAVRAVLSPRSVPSRLFHPWDSSKVQPGGRDFLNPKKVLVTLRVTLPQKPKVFELRTSRGVRRVL